LTAASAQYYYKQVVEVSLDVIVLTCQNHSSITAVRTIFSLFTYKTKTDIYIYTTIQFFVYSYMFWQNSTIFKASIHKYLKTH